MIKIRKNEPVKSVYTPTEADLPFATIHNSRPDCIYIYFEDDNANDDKYCIMCNEYGEINIMRHKSFEEMLYDIGGEIFVDLTFEYTIK